MERFKFEWNSVKMKHKFIPLDYNQKNPSQNLHKRQRKS